MEKYCIARAKINNPEIRMDDSEKAVLELVIKSTRGSAIYTVETKDITKIFTMLDIWRYNQLSNCPCLVLIQNGIMKDIGNFLWTNYADIYSDGRNNPEWKETVKNDWHHGLLIDLEGEILFS